MIGKPKISNIHKINQTEQQTEEYYHYKTFGVKIT
jgi:hypothetical protein